MLAEEVKQDLVTTLVLLLVLSVVQVGTSSHPAVDLSGEGLNVLGDLQVGTEGIDIGSGLVLGGKHGEGNLDRLGVVGVDHGGVALSTSLEGVVLASESQSSDLTTPAETEDGPVKGAVGAELVGILDDLGDLREVVGRSGLGREELAEELLVLIGGGRVPGDIGGAALEEVGDENAVLLLGGVGEDIGTLDGLVEEAENVYTRY